MYVNLRHVVSNGAGGAAASPGEGAAPPGEIFKILAPIFAPIPNFSPSVG